MFTVYEKLLTKELFHKLHERLCDEPGWKFGLVSDSENVTENSLRIWAKDLFNDKVFTDILFEKICDLTKLNFEMLRVYANGQTYGLSGDLHIDEERDNHYTFLYYTNPKWLAEWGGYTIFTEMSNKIQDKLTSSNLKNNTETINTKIFIPKPNTGILYKSNVTHAGLEPTRHCKELRITVAYKLKLKDMRD